MQCLGLGFRVKIQVQVVECLILGLGVDAGLY